MAILLKEAFPALIVLEQKLCRARYVHETQYKMRRGRWKGLRLRSRRAHAAGVLPFDLFNKATSNINLMEKLFLAKIIRALHSFMLNFI